MKAEYLQHKDGTRFIPITQPDAVIDSEGLSLTTKLADMEEEIASKGGGGTSDYTQLSNKPKVNDVELTGNKTLADIGVAAASHTHSIADVENLQSSLSALSQADLDLSLNLNTCQSDIGSKTELKTSVKTDLVSAINEVKDSIGVKMSYADGVLTLNRSDGTALDYDNGVLTI